MEKFKLFSFDHTLPVRINQASLLTLFFVNFIKAYDKSKFKSTILQTFSKSQMKVTVKTLKGEIIDIQVEPVTTIFQIKEKLKEIKGFEVEGQKIVLKGKATQNEDTVEKLNIKDKDFLVVMTTIKKPQSKKQQAPKVEQKKQQKPKQEMKAEQKPQKKEQKKQEDPAFEGKVNELMSMGFPREKCVQALRAAFGNTQVAIEYLLNGIPAGLTEEQGQGQGGLGGTASLAQFREMIQNDPSAIQQVLQQLATTSPELYNLIAQRPELFEQMIMEGGDGDGQQYEQGDESMVPEGEEILVSEAEKQAIERLAALGFSKAEAAQAYFACDKNEELAANLLFDRLANGEIDQGGFEDEQDEGDDDNLFH